MTMRTRTPLYPVELIHPHILHPVQEEFEVRQINATMGRALVSKVAWASNRPLAKFAGVMQQHVLQHTLQVTPDLHIHDPWFIGNLAHSKNPNVFLDMVMFEIWSLRPIAAGDVLAMDYTVTEDRLFKQFIDLDTRTIVHGRKEQPHAAMVAQLKALNALDHLD